MRIVFLFLLIVPMGAKAQAKRSANELAHENIQEYITSKIFKDKVYKPLLYKDITSNKDGTESIWKVVHKFDVANKNEGTSSETTEWRHCTFTFYLSKKMKVLKADGYHLNP